MSRSWECVCVSPFLPALVPLLPFTARVNNGSSTISSYISLDGFRVHVANYLRVCAFARLAAIKAFTAGLDLPYLSLSLFFPPQGQIFICTLCQCVVIPIHGSCTYGFTCRYQPLWRLGGFYVVVPHYNPCLAFFVFSIFLYRTSGMMTSPSRRTR